MARHGRAHRRTDRAAAGQPAARARSSPPPSAAPASSGTCCGCPVTFFSQRSPADLVQRLQSNDAVAETLARDLAAAGVDAVVVVLYAVLLWTYDPQLTLIGVAVALLNVVALRIVIRLRATGTQKLRADERRLTNTVVQRSPTDRDDEGHRRRERILPPLGRQHATTLDGQQRLGVPSAWLASRRAHARRAQQRADPVDRRAAGRGRPPLDRSARRLPGAGRPVSPHRSASSRRRRPGAGLRRRRGPAEGRGALPGRPLAREPWAPAGSRACGARRASPSATARSTPLLTDFSLSVGPGSRSRSWADRAAASRRSRG